MGREWQLSTVQFDFNLPDRFDMTFVDSDGVEKRPYVIHRALLGSIERFFGVLIENYGGAFPVWLSPVQVKVIPVSNKFDDYAKEVEKTLRQAEILVEGDYSDDRMNAKIRNAQNQKIPYMLVVGEKEMNDKAVSIRIITGEQKNGIALDEALALIKDKIEKREMP
jgi:threonyl-tRNA synthetase